MCIDGIKGPVAQVPKGSASGAIDTDCIEALSVSFGVGRAISTPTGAGQNREASRPSLSEVAFTKLGDIASALLFIEASVGTVNRTASIHVLTPASNLELRLQNTLISGLSLGGDEFGTTETVSLNFTRIEWLFVPISASGQPGATIRSCFDTALGRQC